MLCCCSLNFLIEVACNKVLGEGQGHFIGPPDDNVTYTLSKCRLTVRNKSVYKLLMDLKILHDISKVHHNTCITFTPTYTCKSHYGKQNLYITTLQDEDSRNLI